MKAKIRAASPNTASWGMAGPSLVVAGINPEALERSRQPVVESASPVRLTNSSYLFYIRATHPSNLMMRLHRARNNRNTGVVPDNKSPGEAGALLTFYVKYFEFIER